MKDSYKIDTKLSTLNYLNAVDDIADGFFDEKGNYGPHYGRLRATVLFITYCITDNGESIGEIDTKELEEIVDDERFINEFNACLNGSKTELFGFGAAYSDAMKIVDYKISLAGSLTNGINELIKKLPNMNDETIDKINELSKNISNGNFTPDSIVDSYSAKVIDFISNKEKSEDGSEE